MRRLEFDAQTHTYRVGNQRLPSVTEVLGPAETFAGLFAQIPRARMEAARDRGVYIHQAMALLAGGDLDWGSVEPEWLPYIRSGERFLLETGITVTGAEVQVYSSRLRVAGTIDLLGVWMGRDSLIDFKATAAVPVTVGPQTAGYQYLYAESHGNRKLRVRRYCVHLREHDYRVIPLADPRDESIFLSALNLYHWGTRENAAAAA